MNATKYVYFFGDGKAEGSVELKSLLGGKGANLAEMTNIGIMVPPGFTISTEACKYYYANDGAYPEGLEDTIAENLARLEKVVGKGFGDAKNPMLLSVRSGAVFSMPGMMDTVLNIGLNDKSVAAIMKKTGNERFVYDSYRRFVQGTFGRSLFDAWDDGYRAEYRSERQKRGGNHEEDRKRTVCVRFVPKVRADVWRCRFGDGT